MTLSGRSLEASLTEIARAGVRCVELSCSPEHFDPGRTDPDQVGRLLHRLGLAAPVGHSPIGDTDCGDLNEDHRRASVATIGACLAPLACMGAECVVVHANGPFVRYTHENVQASLASSRRSIVELTDMAGEAGIKIAVENLPSYGQPRPGHSMAQLREVIADLPEHVGLCLDTGHAVLSGCDLAEELADAGARLLHIHAHDTDGSEDRHWVPGRGVIDWPAFLARLDALGFAGSRVLELVSSDPDSPDDTLQQAWRLASNWNRGNHTV